MKVRGRRCNNCDKITYDVFAEKGWILIDDSGTRITNGRNEDGVVNIEVCFTSLKYTLTHDSLDFCSLRCFLEWVFLSDDTSNKRAPLKERREFMQEMLRASRLKFY